MLNYGLAILLFIDTYCLSKYVNHQANFILLFSFVSTFIMPVLMVWLMYRMQLISSIKISVQKERTLPYSVILIMLCFSAYQFYINDLNGLPLQFLLSTILCLFLNIIINFFIKISSHAIAGSGFCAFTLKRLIDEHSEFLWIFVISVLVLSLILWSRLILKAHKPTEIIWGCFIGFFTVFLFSFIWHTVV